MLQIADLTYRVAGRPLLEGASLTVNDGEKVALVGRNGTGKSSLLRLITGEAHADAGDIEIPDRVRVGVLPQDAPSGPESLIETVLAADRERARLLAEAETATDAHRISDIHERLATIKAESAPARAARILAGLGFPEPDQGRACAEFSGGWRMRVALAALLFSQPDILLLDEPTNHLDLEATLWLEGFLKRYPGTLLLVSHDRDLLNRIPEAIIHLEHMKLTRYAGNYDRFERTRREKQAHLAALKEKQEAQRKHIQAFVDRFRYKASKARQAQSRLKALAKMEPIVSMIDSHTQPITFPQPSELAPPLMTLERADVGYVPGKPVLRRLDLRLDQDDRIALLGANGNGKSTLVKLLAGRLGASEGRVNRSRGLKVGYFSQDQADELDLSVTPLQTLARLEPRLPEEKLRAQLGRFGFGQEKVGVEIAKLSGGEKARLLLALVTRQAPQLLLLDEPTNHLDIDTRESLVQALNDYAGAVVLVSHDPHLIELVADRLWLVAEGRVQPYEGDLEDYRKLLLSTSRGDKAAEKDAAPRELPGGETAASRKEKRKAAAEARAAQADLRKAVREAEAEMEKLGQRLAKLEQRLADPEVYNGSTAKLMELQLEHGKTKQAIAEAEESWLSAQAALEESPAA